VRLSARALKRYRDISWLMPDIDVVSILERLGAEKIGLHEGGREVHCLCPDHEMFTGRCSSHPNWTCNSKTGMTYCRTEPRGSNLVWTVCRVRGCNPKEAVEWMTGSKIADIPVASLRHRIGKLSSKHVPDEVVRDPVQLRDISKDLANRYLSDSCYKFFVHPPGKRFPTNISASTVDRFSVFERCWGYYGNRAIIPFFNEGEVVGFVAIDLLGKKRWLEEHPLNSEGDYRKTLYPLNFSASNYLFGYDECENGAESIIVTEGPREKMKLSQEGFPNSVACLKAELSPDQIVLLGKKSVREVILMFDGDVAGYSATKKNAKKLEGVFKVRKCIVPLGLDPKNLDRSGIEKIINGARIS